MTPAGLDHADLWIGEKMDRMLKQIWRRNEIGVEDANKLARGRLESGRKGTGLESGPINSMNQLNIEATLPQFFRARSSHFPRIVGRIVQDLDLQQFSRIIELADRAQKALHYVNFVKNRKLNGHSRQLPKPARRNHCAFAVFQEEITDEIPVNAVSREAEEHGEETRRPDHIAEASLHQVACQLLSQQVLMMAFPAAASHQKWRHCLCKTEPMCDKLRTVS